MTFPEFVPKVDSDNTGKMKSDIGKIFSNVVKKAAKEKRMTTAVIECAKLLQSSTERVVLCILPRESSSDDSDHIQQVLIEAYCREHRINIVKVDSEKKFENLLLSSDIGMKSGDIDVSCVLIEKPRKDQRDDPGLRKLCTLLCQEAHASMIDIPV